MNIFCWIILQGNEGKRGKLFCPEVDKIQTGEIYLPEGYSKTIVIQGINFPAEPVS